MTTTIAHPHAHHDTLPGSRMTTVAQTTMPALRKRPRLKAPRMEALGIAPCKEAVQQARHALNATMARWRIGPEATFRAEVIASELLTNALQHARPAPGGRIEEVGLHLAEDQGTVLVEVDDSGCGSIFTPMPSVAPQDGEAEHGRGLLLVEELGNGWGRRRLGNGHHSVWAYVTADETRGPR